jgi:hypothetical protein
LAGIIISRASLPAAYWIDVVSFGLTIALTLRMLPMRPEGAGTSSGLESIREGLRYLKGERTVQGALVIDINAMVFGMPRALFPELAATRFGGGAGVVGLLNAAPGVGAMASALSTGWLERIDRQGRAVFLAVFAWGAAVAAFGVVPWLVPALVLLAIAGWADIVSAVFRSSISNRIVPDNLRGRLAAVRIFVVTGGPRLGDAEAGAVAALTSAPVSAWTGGLACMAGCGVIARAWPELARWRQSGHRS